MAKKVPVDKESVGVMETSGIEKRKIWQVIFVIAVLAGGVLGLCGCVLESSVNPVKEELDAARTELTALRNEVGSKVESYAELSHEEEQRIFTVAGNVYSACESARSYLDAGGQAEIDTILNETIYASRQEDQALTEDLQYDRYYGWILRVDPNVLLSIRNAL